MRFRCYHCPCHHRVGVFLEFEADKPECPQCGSKDGKVLELVDVHFLVQDDQGPIWGQDNVRWRIACEPKREILAQGKGDTYSATHEPIAVTCPSCRGVKEFREMITAQARDRRGHLARQVLEDLGRPKNTCC